MVLPGIHQRNAYAAAIQENETERYLGTLPASVRASLTPW
jgi:hypothetical protein